ncbi:hypothetical protein AUJ66_01290 [Candidatus Desantisbacteria bacterium CG1_02_38_46]|uniref:Glycosyl transferase family 1 n=3 Tax=unclassified Candidatus Desantisiibacteriota TaxID=3106372 RepID=A0A2H9PB42_9BACT|nr:MAG: hypothetical protein AUJ66_01290 [Candidatus Desantisbacteria bacterium CG1_02_38_46]PIU51153.1 MAG: glycosyl transferase family 1 [Candidatus Desantisbacteria bacterium CG07_land_8_20_14_0_80_39_15]PIZ14933.1 MAG: glycosyl transferase family 1 [Candidatus Desantisbacteria bacterium CG_4_10_14_0_8_um_filter_39_17]
MKIAYLSTYPPRECGIATFAKDLINAVESVGGLVKSEVIAVNQEEAAYNYEPRVKIQINANNLREYLDLAQWVSNSNIDVVNVQHEFGIYGGPRGKNLVFFLRTVNKPVVTTLHTVLPKPGPMEKIIIKNIADYSNYVVVMANKAVQMLKYIYRVPEKKIRVIPHGVPDVKPVSRDTLNEFLNGYSNRIILSTFGLISEGKGIEYAIMAMPRIVQRHPNATYFIIGETHPEVRKKEGERYRLKLIRLVNNLKLEDHVKFHNRYLALRELVRYLQATSVYITPYLNPDQITSGTLAYALSCGKVSVSTPYLYAREMLADGRGFLAKFRDPDSISWAVNKVLDDGQLKKRIEKRAYNFSRQMIWSNVGRKYLSLFRETLK